MSKSIWPEVTVNGMKLPSSGFDGVEVTPEFLVEWLGREKRPESYTEGDVYVKLSYLEIARLFGPVNVSYKEAE